MELFGFQIGKKQEEELPKTVESFAPPANIDGAYDVNEGGAYGTTIDMDGSAYHAKNEAGLISRYRQMARQPECERAIDDIINEAIITDEKEPPVSIVVDNVEMPEKIREAIREEFDSIIDLLNFNNNGYDIFRNWYVDGRIFFHIMVDTANPRAGIQELRYIDPRKIKKVRVAKRKNEIKNNQFVPKQYDEYYIYAERGVSAGNQGIKVAPDSICYVHSGVMDENNKLIQSHLHKAIKPLNQLRMLEDATVIYRLARAPERRIFYIDVGNLPKAKAEQYLRDMMAKHKNKLVYDANSGEIRDDRKFMTMLEDYWLPRREGGKSTEITTLPAGQNLGELEDVDYFRKKLYESLNVPIARLESDSQFNMGRSSEITRDEVKFARFINRLRNRFNELFNTLLERQLLLKGIITKPEWKMIKSQIFYDFLEDNHFAELKNTEILQSRLTILQDIDQYVGKYYSVEYVRKHVLQQTEEDIEEIDSQIEMEREVEDADFDFGGNQDQDQGGKPNNFQ
jgi:hypothetical protein